LKIRFDRNIPKRRTIHGDKVGEAAALQHTDLAAVGHEARGD
jgi:hypothetical protein